jgi:hypothetical protein
MSWASWGKPKHDGSASNQLSAPFELCEEAKRVRLSELSFYLASNLSMGVCPSNPSASNPSARTKKTFKLYCTNKYHKNGHTYGGEGQYHGNYSNKTSKKFPFSFSFSFSVLPRELRISSVSTFFGQGSLKKFGGRRSARSWLLLPSLELFLFYRGLLSRSVCLPLRISGGCRRNAT